MYQAGINSVTLFENKGVDFLYYDAENLRNITNLTSTGDQIYIENNQQPKLSIKSSVSDSGEIVYAYDFEFFLFGLTNDNITLIDKIKRSIVGYCLLIKFYDGVYRFYNLPFKCNESEIDTNSEMLLRLKLNNPAPSLISHLDYVPEVNTTPVYRTDTTILTADTTIYTADYAL